MHIIKSKHDLVASLLSLRRKDEKVTIGFIPTMGALHSGHASLIDESVSENTITVCSIFVNPTQFGDKSDLDKYPKPIEKDIEILIKHKCDILFLPEFEDVYSANCIQQKFELGELEFTIEGASRPGHFQGVCNVVHRLFEIIKPDWAYFGQKDYQQTAIIKSLIKLTRSDVILKIVPTKREPNGLAMSSRNIRLSETGRKNAAFIYKALRDIRSDIETRSLTELVERAKQFISSQKGADLDYLRVVDAETLHEVTSLKQSADVVVLVAVTYEGVRLIDNIFLT
ncbi:MAG TPA: pantoate--beta-alanine ligase [Bacteroidetes bacterium]|jgi:pantoate--beta-alanine ligase|nr:pantoate--beta-alanine ligase [Bacteroidota bacterium]|tara:strand:+ start:429 stop:1280 length:852 start_codon:yes stop_codon:yes gene_type:complete